jgi:flagellar hook-length control protein FliK
LQALQAHELQTGTVAAADSKGTAPETAKNSAAAAAGKSAAPAGDKKKPNAEAAGKGSAPGATVALAGLPAGTSNPAVAVAVPVMAVTAQQALSARGRSAAPAAAGNPMPKGQTATAVPGQSLAQNASQASGPMGAPLNGARVSSAEGKAANKFTVPPGMVQASDPGLQPAEAALPQSEGAGNAGNAGNDAGVVAAQGKALSSAGTMALGGAAVPDRAAPGGKPADKVVAAGGLISSLTVSGTPMTALHPGAAATPSSPQVSGGGGNPAPVAGSNPYARLDEASAPAVLHASPQQMTVAVHDASLGSLQVQVQSVNGQLAASLATATTAAHTQLSGHLASLAGYLQDQRVDVARVTVAPQSFSSHSGSSQGGGPQSGGSGGQPQQQSYASPASATLSGPQPRVLAGSAPAATASPRAAISSASSIDLHA